MSTRMNAVFLILVLAVAEVAGAQETTGNISGRIVDAQELVVPGVTVTLSGPNLQGTRTALTDGEGFYRFRNVPPGTGYQVTATISGFRDAVQEGVQVFLGQGGTVNLTMALAGIAEQVTVRAPVPLVDVTRTTAGVNITADLFATLPSFRGPPGRPSVESGRTR